MTVALFLLLLQDSYSLPEGTQMPLEAGILSLTPPSGFPTLGLEGLLFVNPFFWTRVLVASVGFSVLLDRMWFQKREGEQ